MDFIIIQESESYSINCRMAPNCILYVY